MSEQHLFKFQQESDYKTAKRNHLLVPNISTVVETGNTYINPMFSSKETAEAGDIVVFHEDENTGEVTVKYMKPEAFDINDGYWTADSIVVVPFSHTNDGTVRVMGLNFASVTTPSTGGDGEGIKWGNNLPEDYKKFGSFTVFSSINGQTIEDTIGINTTGYLPSDIFEDTQNAVLNPFDEQTYYKQNYDAIVISSPYNNDGSENEAYHSIGDFKNFSQNPLQDMDGQTNTSNLLGLLDSQYLTDSLYAQTIINQETTEISGETIQLYPAATACARYGTVLKPCTFDDTKTYEENKETMPWYLPSAGELGYILTRIGRINYALEQVGKTAFADEIEICSSTVTNGENSLPPFITAFATELSTVHNLSSQVATDLYVVPFCKL
jgi:hypothetical protein